ncbi:class I SAM-dependent methyltransferase [Bradyrhizobium sp. 160]|uniref:class I SAM-dependent methyltransferase n=1 Tax=Bradyrhizobium sp. 160 TaxID=2782634 RepID=UPI001FFBBF97|nr:class I SAM-dependent methyltransferase [Bradyrhizobium sp. 160]MCK1624662.1 class I SAM-dependent methyltransferase [Bradyrhizobium sp. 160]
MAEDLYEHPDVYDLACCSFRNLQEEPDGLHRLFQKFALIPVRSVLELGCGPAPNAGEFVIREYNYIGLDICSSMLEYCRRKHAALGSAAQFILADMRHFSLPLPVQAVVIIAGSFLAGDADDALAILNSVARALVPGGLVVFDSCIQCPRTDPMESHCYELHVGARRLSVMTGPRQFDVARQTVDYELFVAMNERGQRTQYRSIDHFQLFYPQEFRLLVERSGQYEFLDWWDGWDLTHRLGGVGPMKRPILALRRLNSH